jgi:hypothetical protein
MFDLSTTDLFVIVLGIIAAGLLVLIDRLTQSRKDELTAIAALFQEPLKSIVALADVKLAAYGEALKPLHELVQAADTLIDDDTDFVVQALPDEVIAAARKILDYADRLTDGTPPEETKPLGEPDTVPERVVAEMKAGGKL